MAIYLQLQGVTGEATHKDYTGWMVIHSMHKSVNRRIDTPVGDAMGRVVSAPTISEITCRKISDRSTPMLFQFACAGQPKGVTATIHLTPDGTDRHYLEFALQDALISNYSMSSDGDYPVETFSINFTKIELTHIPYDSDNNPQAAVKVGFDLAQGQAS